MTTRLLILLVLLTVLPAMGMLWLMNRAAAIETTAGQQQVLEAYRGQLRLVRSRLDPLWRAHAAHLEEGAATPEERFTRLVTQEQADGVLVLGDDGMLLYPDRAARDQLRRDGGAADARSKRLAADAGGTAAVDRTCRRGTHHAAR